MIGLVFIGIAEAVVYHYRYRSAVGDNARHAGVWAFGVCALRAAFVALGAFAVIHGHGVVTVVALYAAPAGVATWVVHKWDTRRIAGPQHREEATHGRESE